MGMEADYVWNLSVPAEQLKVLIESRRDDQTMFCAAMSLERREITDRNLTLTLLSYPLVTVKIVAAIYFEALRLWWKKCPYFPHPQKSEKPGPTVNPRSETGCATESAEPAGDAVSARTCPGCAAEDPTRIVGTRRKWSHGTIRGDFRRRAFSGDSGQRSQVLFERRAGRESRRGRGLSCGLLGRG